MSERFGGLDRMADLAPAYALGVLSPEEARSFEQALVGSPELQRELAEYREVCALLATAGSSAPPAALKERLLQRVRAARDAELRATPAPGVQLVTLTTTGAAPPVVQVFWDRGKNVALLHAFRLKPAPAGRAYQLWLLPRQGNPIPSSVFNPEPDGRGVVSSIPVPAEHGIAGFALTEEPASGSPQPTSTPFLVGMADGR